MKQNTPLSRQSIFGAPIRQSLNHVLKENQKLEVQILEQKNEISFDLFCKWRSNLQKIGEYLVDHTFCCIAQKYDSYILSNAVNFAAYSSFTRFDVQSKGFTIKEQTLKQGIRGGFLESQSFEFTMKPLYFWIQGQRFSAVERDGRECLVKEVVSSDSILKVCCNINDEYIISDIDLISIFLKNNSDEIIFDENYGELTIHELAIIQEINQSFQENLCTYFGGGPQILNSAPPYCLSSFKMIAHGPANRFSNSKASHLHYPLKLCTPFFSVEFLGQEMDPNSMNDLINFNEKMKSLGYHVFLNPKWKF